MPGPGTKVAFGLPQVTTALPLCLGTYFFVHSGRGSDGNTGLKPEKPLATLAKAITLCTSGYGDCVVILPGHTEAVTATSHTLSKSMVTIVGLGNGVSRPVFTYGAAAATITVSAANVTLQNLHFVANFADVASAFTTSTAKDLTIQGCSFIDTSSSLNFLCIVTTDATNNRADGLSFLGNYVYGLAVTDGAVISILANQLRVKINDNTVDKAATNDAGHLVTLSSKIVGGIQILRNNLTVVGSSGAAVGVMGTGSGSTSSGIIAYNLVSSLDTTAALIFTAATGISFLENYMTGAVDKSGSIYPAVDNPA